MLRECSNKEQIDQIPLLLDVKDFLLQVKALDKDGHYTRVEKGILEQCNYNNVYLQNDADKAEEIICTVLRNKIVRNKESSQTRVLLL